MNIFYHKYDNILIYILLSTCLACIIVTPIVLRAPGHLVSLMMEVEGGIGRPHRDFNGKVSR